MQELCFLFCTDLFVGWWSEESVVTWIYGWKGSFCTEGYSSLKTEGGQIFAEGLVCSLYDGARKALLCGRGQGLGERVRGFFVPRDIQAWSPREVESCTEDTRDLLRPRSGFWVLFCCGGEVIWKILVLWVKLNILIFCVFFVFGGVSLVKEDKKKIYIF